jgi:hypothetical protein
MSPSQEESRGNPWVLVLAGIVVLACILAASFLLGGVSETCTPVACDCPTGPLLTPVFTDPAQKIAELADSRFTTKLYAEAIAYEPLLGAPGTQVHMGFWSGRGNHGSMVRLLDAINEGPAATADPPNRAICDEGVTAYYAYPSYVRILDEHWYERAAAVNGTAMIFGQACQDPHPVTFAQADEIWGEYSARYTDMAEMIARATGRPVKAWCFVEGARANRIFSMYELPQLQKLEEQGLVEVCFARNQQADWTNPADWINGTANTPIPTG